jgi:dynein light chain 4
MDKKYGKSWHCIIGEGYGYSINYEVKNLLYMYFNGNLAILVFKGIYLLQKFITPINTLMY